MEKSLEARLQHAVIDDTNTPATGPRSTSSSVLKKGEIVFNEDIDNFRVGDGSHSYANLDDFIGKTISSVSQTTSGNTTTTTITYSDGTTTTITVSDGTSFNIKGAFDDTSSLPSTGQAQGDGYLINGHLWVYTGSTASGSVNGFIDCGSIQGPAGSSSYLYIRFAASNTPTAANMHSSWQTGDIYIGFCVTISNTAPTTYTDYTWSEYTSTDTTYKTTLNGTTNGDSTNGVNLGSWYAPTTAGTQYDLLQANATGVPSWFTPNATGLLKFTSNSGLSIIDVGNFLQTGNFWYCGSAFHATDFHTWMQISNTVRPTFLSGTGISFTTGMTADSPAYHWLKISLANSGVTANTYGSVSSSPSHGGTFNIPRITVDATGRITSASNSIITLPSSGSGTVPDIARVSGDNPGLLKVFADVNAPYASVNEQSVHAVPVFYGVANTILHTDANGRITTDSKATMHYVNVMDILQAIDADQSGLLKPFIRQLLYDMFPNIFPRP